MPGCRVGQDCVSTCESRDRGRGRELERESRRLARCGRRGFAGVTVSGPQSSPSRKKPRRDRATPPRSTGVTPKRTRRQLDIRTARRTDRANLRPFRRAESRTTSGASSRRREEPRVQSLTQSGAIVKCLSPDFPGVVGGRWGLFLFGRLRLGAERRIELENKQHARSPHVAEPGANRQGRRQSDEHGQKDPA